MNRRSEKERLQDYQDIADILVNNRDARTNNGMLIKAYYQSKGLTFEQSLKRNDVLNYQSVERMGRLIKAKNPWLKSDKSEEEAIYKDMALELPVVVRLI